MDSTLLAWAGAIWLGILTSVSPCPLATNIAAVSFIGRNVDHPAKALAAGLLYAFGRMMAYLALAAFIVAGTLSVPALSIFLQQHINQLLGPIFILTAMALFGFVSFGTSGATLSEKAQRLAGKGGFLAAFLLGVLFALALCPISAALFFGSLIPLALTTGSPLILPLLYGLGTALPVVAFALALVFSAQSVGRLFNRVTALEKWVRATTGTIFLLLGFYFTLVYIFDV